MKELIENNISTLYISEFSLEKNLKFKSLIVMYLTMTRNDNNIEGLINILINVLNKDNNFRINNEPYINIIISYALSNNIDYNKIIYNMITDGYCFHSTNGAFKESILENGLILKNKPWNLQDIDIIKNIFSKYNKKDIFGLYQGEDKTPIHIAFSLLSSSYYAISSPTWFLHFTSGGMKSNEIDKEAYRNRDYNSCLNNVINIIEKYKLNPEESNIVINFFNENYKILANNMEPILLLIKREKIKKIDFIEKKDYNETDFEYIKRIFNLYCTQNIIVKNNIDKKDIIVIDYIKNKENKKII